MCVRGPIKPRSNRNKRYFPSFIDDFTRKTWIYFLHEKSKAFAMFRTFKPCVDRGGELTSNEFKEFCKVQGISRQLTAPYTPQQNGVVERENRTIMNYGAIYAG